MTKRKCNYKTPKHCSHFYVFCRYDDSCEFKGDPIRPQKRTVFKIDVTDMKFKDKDHLIRYLGCAGIDFTVCDKRRGGE